MSRKLHLPKNAFLSSSWYYCYSLLFLFDVSSLVDLVRELFFLKITSDGTCLLLAKMYNNSC